MAGLNRKIVEDLEQEKRNKWADFVDKIKWSILDWKLIQKKEKEAEKSASSQNEAGS